MKFDFQINFLKILSCRDNSVSGFLPVRGCVSNPAALFMNHLNAYTTMSKKQSFQLIYQVDADELVDVVHLAWEILGEMGMEPKSIRLPVPDGRQLPWNAFLADKFAAEGHISEHEFIEMSLSTEN